MITLSIQKMTGMTALEILTVLYEAVAKLGLAMGGFLYPDQ